MTAKSYLDSLNSAQLKAVQHPPTVPLQILAGPGSGKTKVLTSRIAHLIHQHSISPSSICAVTFTNKAANEMRERLNNLIGKDETAQIKLGTFHALCALFLRKYSNLIGLESNFTVCDADESKKIVSKLLKLHAGELDANDINLKEGTILSLISKAKAKGYSPDDYISSLKSQESSLQDAIQTLIASIYVDYTETLRRSNSLDFDDLLCYGVKLFRDNSRVVDWCQHILVDEFQDTNIMQYELMRYISSANECVTIVGDPDQSIYGWRSAEVANLGKMRKDFPATKQILLEHNYRSTQSILAASLAIVAQDKTRIPKTLHSSHPPGPCPVLCNFSTENAEAAFVAAEIKRIAAYMGGMLTWNDFVVLLRFNALSRTIESALQKEGIPSRVLGGHKFFERLEIKDLLAYLQLVDNPQFVPAFVRAVNVPPRGIGEKTISAVIARADLMKTSPLDVVSQIYDGKIPDIKPAIRNKIKSFVQPIRKLKLLADGMTSPSDLICRLLELIEYEAHLKKTQQDWESRWENVQELLTFSREVESHLEEQTVQQSRLPDVGSDKELEREIDDYWMDDEHELEVDETESFGVIVSSEGQDVRRRVDVDGTSPLRAFLQASMLSTDTESQEEQVSNDKVTISTCHAAKGLEWPVVMVPAVEQGTFPSQRADDVEEERRLLYVACTRAQGLLYLTHSTRRMFAGESKAKEVSEFVSSVRKDNWKLFSTQPKTFNSGDRALIATVCGRSTPNEAEVKKMVDEFNRTHNQANLRYESSSAQVPVSQPPQDGFQSTTSLFSRKNAPFQARGMHSTHKPLIASNVVNANPTPSVVPAPAKPVHESIPSQVAQQHTAAQTFERPMPVPPRSSTAQSPQIKQQRIPMNKSAQPVVVSSQPSSPVQQPSLQSSSGGKAATVVGSKRRLGMGHSSVGYFPNKKFKPPTV